MQTLAALSGVSKRYGAVVALDGLDLEVRRGELLAVLGPNGAGKTTAIATLLGLVRPDSGVARLFDLPPQALAARRRIGVMLQEAFLPPELRVREHIDLVASYYPRPRGVAEVLALGHITALAQRAYGKLSGGEKRQVQLAIALCGRPDLLFLDEPTVGLDVQAREGMWATLRDLVHGGAAIVLTTHYLEEAEALADRVVVMARGRQLSSGSVGELRARVTRKQVSARSAIDLATIAAWPETDGATRDRERTDVTTRQPEALVRRWLAADPLLGELEVRRGGLADVFRELTETSAS